MQQINPKTSYKPNGKSDLSIDLKMKQITNIDNIFEDQRIIDANHLILSYNSIKFITENIYQIKNLLSLNISSNQLKEIINLQKFQKIEYLNFSTNKLTNVQNMGSLFSLVHLDLSINYIEKIDEFYFPNLRILILSGNNIKHIENLEKCANLEILDISKNKLEDLGQLETKVFKELKKFICSYNYLNVDYLKEVITIFKKSPKIEELNFIGNEIQINKLYKDKLIALNKLKVLDGVTLVLELKQPNSDKEKISYSTTNKNQSLDRIHLDSDKNIPPTNFNSFNMKSTYSVVNKSHPDGITNQLDDFMNFVSNYKMTSTNEKYKQNQEILAKWKQNNKNQQANNNSITNISPKHLQERIIQPMIVNRSPINNPNHIHDGQIIKKRPSNFSSINYAEQDISKIISSPSKESKPDKEKQLNLSPKNKNIGSLSNTNSETLLEQPGKTNSKTSLHVITKNISISPKKKDVNYISEREMSSYSYDLSEEEEKNKIKTQPKEMNRTPSLNFLPNIKTRHKIKAKSKTDELSQKIAERLDKLNEKSNSKLNISIGKTNMDGIKIDWKQKRIDFFARKHLLKKEDEQLKLIAKSRNSLREEVNQKISDKNEKTSKCTLF